MSKATGEATEMINPQSEGQTMKNTKTVDGVVLTRPIAADCGGGEDVGSAPTPLPTASPAMSNSTC
jgi:hypothetical protein